MLSFLFFFDKLVIVREQLAQMFYYKIMNQKLDTYDVQCEKIALMLHMGDADQTVHLGDKDPDQTACASVWSKPLLPISSIIFRDGLDHNYAQADLGLCYLHMD